MKCKNCGSNLEIDNEKCPYCGSINTIAQKHRDDMKKYASDYDATKQEVISNTRRFNAKTLKITVIAVTVAVMAILIPIAASTDSIGRAIAKKKTLNNEAAFIPRIEALIEQEDYFALDELAQANYLTQYGFCDDKYADLLRLTSNYADIYQEILTVLESNGSKNSNYAETLGLYLRNHFNRLKYLEQAEEKYRTYSEHLNADMKLMLKTYLNISEEQFDELSTMSDNKRNLTIEEVLNELKGR